MLMVGYGCFDEVRCLEKGIEVRMVGSLSVSMSDRDPELTGDTRGGVPQGIYTPPDRFWSNYDKLLYVPFSLTSEHVFHIWDDVTPITNTHLQRAPTISNAVSQLGR